MSAPGWWLLVAGVLFALGAVGLLSHQQRWAIQPSSNWWFPIVYVLLAAAAAIGLMWFGFSPL